MVVPYVTYSDRSHHVPDTWSGLVIEKEHRQMEILEVHNQSQEQAGAKQVPDTTTSMQIDMYASPASAIVKSDTPTTFFKTSVTSPLATSLLLNCTSKTLSKGCSGQTSNIRAPPPSRPSRLGSSRTTTNPSAASALTRSTRPHRYRSPPPAQPVRCTRMVAVGLSFVRHDRRSFTGAW
jgi:hypothetical protein